MNFDFGEEIFHRHTFITRQNYSQFHAVAVTFKFRFAACNFCFATVRTKGCASIVCVSVCPR